MALSGNALAEAYVRVRADMSQVGPDVRKGLQGAVDAAGRTTGEQMKQAVTKPLKESLNAGAQVAGTAGEQAGTKFRGGVASRMKETAVDAEKAGRTAGRRFSEAQTVSVKEGGVKFSETIREGLKAGLVGLTAGMAGLGAIEVFKNLIEGADAARKATAITEKVIETTGGAAHVTAEDVDKLAESISNKTGIDAEQVHSSENLLLTFTNVKNEVGKGNDVFNQATGLIQDMSVALGQDAKSSAIQLGKALQDPIKGATALRRVGVALDDQQKIQIATFVKAGDVMSAQKVILGELGKEFGGAAEAAATPLGKLQAQLTNTGRGLAGYLLPVIDATATGTAKLVGLLGEVPAPVYAGVAAFAALRLGMLGVTAAMTRLSAVGGITGIVTALRAGLGGLVTLLGGPWGIALAGASVAVGVFVNHLQAERDQQDSLRASLDQTTAALTKQTTEHVSLALQQQGVLKSAAALGVNLQDVTQAALGNADAQARVNAVLAKWPDYSKAAASAGARVSTALVGNALAAKNVRDAVGGMNDSVKDAVAAQKEAIASTQQVAEASGEAASTTKVLVSAQIGSQKAFTKTVESADGVRTAYDLAKDALNAWLQVIADQDSAFLGERAAIRAYKDAVAAATQAVKDNGHTLNDNTTKGRANEAVLDGITTKATDVLAAMLKNNRAGPAIRAEWQAQRDRLFAVYMQFDHNKTKALDYVNNALGKIPPSVSTSILTPGAAAAQQAAKAYLADLKALQGVRTITVRANADGSFTKVWETASGGTRSTTMRAAGGIISGPGGPKDDRIHTMLSNGEFVVNAAATGRHRELLEAINSGAPATGRAAGGLVSTSRTVYQALPPSHFTADFVNGMSVVASTLKNYLGAAGGPAGPVPGGSGVARWGPSVHRALTLLGEPQSLWDNWMRQINTESGGNANAINLWDSNAKAGHPSQGLLQTIPGTFAAYHWPGTSWNIRDGWANLMAAMNYGKHRYGSSQEAVIGHGHGYAAGTRYAAPGWAWVGEHGRELVRFAGGEQVKSATASRMGAGDAGPVRLHPDTVAQLGAAIAGAIGRQPVVLDGHTLAGYVDRSLGRNALSVRG